MEESWEDLLCRVYLAGYEDCQHERGFDPKSVKVVHTARISAALLEQRILKLESVNADLYEALRDAMRTARKDFATKEEFEAAYPEQVAALAKARGK